MEYVLEGCRMGGEVCDIFFFFSEGEANIAVVVVLYMRVGNISTLTHGGASFFCFRCPFPDGSR